MDNFSDLFEPLSENQQPLLVGIVIDVSNSMRRSWHNKDGKKLPRIEVIRDCLNKFIKKEQQKKRSNGESSAPIDIFCLGMGFKILVHETDTHLSFEQEHSLKYYVQTRQQVDIVCDLLALGEILPSQKELDDFKKRLNQKWVYCSKDILEKSVIAEDAYTQLVDYVQQALYDSAIKRVDKSISYRFSKLNIFNRISGNLPKFLEKRREKITTTSKTASLEYADSVFKRIKQDFGKNKYIYIYLIYKHLSEFAQTYIDSVLRALTLGFEIPELVEDLNEQRAMELARYIQADLEAEVRQHISMSLALYEKKLFFAGRQIAASLNKGEIKRLTERFIRKHDWDMLRALIEETVLSLFSEQFEIQVQKNFPYWIQLASAREVTRSLKDLKDILPEVIQEKVYSDDVMFGSTPFKQAIDKAAIRLIDRQNADKKRILLIISDGEFEEINPSMTTVNLLKRRDVAIITCVVAGQNIISQLVKFSSWNWPLGTRLMLDMASKASDLNSEGVEWKEVGNTHRLRDEKLCFQINHSSILEEILEIIFDGRS